MLNRKAIQYIVSILLFLLFFVLGYKIERYETAWLILCYSLIFTLYAWIILKNSKEQLPFWIATAIGLRILLLFSVPNLSDDFYRFIWDGRLLVSGYHPFAHIPSFYVENNIVIPGIDETLYSNLNSKTYFTIYPPVAQVLFWLSAMLSSSIYGSLLILKVCILLAEIGTIFLLRRLLNQFSSSTQSLLIYALNPLVIIELIGNVHFEAILIFFILLTCYFLTQQRLALAAFFMATSICVKLIPVIFLPAILPFLGRKKAMVFYVSTAVICLLFFLPLLNTTFFFGFKNSIGYYFSKFEFNASLYYIVRGMGYFFRGYNIIQIAGTILGAIAGILIVIISFRNFKAQVPTDISIKTSPIDHRAWAFFQAMMWSLLIYFLFTTTLHPWYITTLLAVSIFSGLQFAILWTFTIFLSYAGYTLGGFEENLWVVTFEYVTVLGYLAYELLWKKNTSSAVV